MVCALFHYIILFILLCNVELWQKVKCSGWCGFQYLFMHLYPSEVLMCRAHPSEGGEDSSVLRETWFLLLIGGTVLTLVLGFVGMLYLRRRQALSKELGHLNGLCNRVDITPFYYGASDLRVRGQGFGLPRNHNIFSRGQLL
jgi:hypothetical protein